MFGDDDRIEQEERAARIAAVRQLCDILDANPQLVVPWPFYGMSVYPGDAETAAKWVRVLKAATGRSIEKNYEGETAEFTVKLGPEIEGRWDPYVFALDVRISRNEVCTAHVVGTQEVTKKVYPKVEPVEVTVTEDVIEWDCHPLLGD